MCSSYGTRVAVVVRRRHRSPTSQTDSCLSLRHSCENVKVGIGELGYRRHNSPELELLEVRILAEPHKSIEHISDVVHDNRAPLVDIALGPFLT